MKVTPQQATALFLIAYDTIPIIAQLGELSREQRADLLNDIMHNQSNELPKENDGRPDTEIDK